MTTKIILPKYVANFMAVFEKAGYEIYVVGGAIRDLLLKRPINNWDFATNANPDEIQKMFEKSIYNNTYGTVIIPKEIDGQKILFEVTPYRKESRYADFRHPGKIEWAKTIEQDLKRRDFTINAMAYDGKRLVDITGGMSDLEKKIIRSVGDPSKRFKEDALRLMRAVRLSSELEFLIEGSTKDAISKNAHLIIHISWERIRDELFRILKSGHPSEGILFLKNTRLLREILPELDVSFSISQKSPKRHHIYDVGTHLVHSLQACPSKDVIVRFATLLHDIGKVETYEKDRKTGIITFYNHEIVGSYIAMKIARRLKLSKKQEERLVKYIRYHMFSVTEKQTDKAIRRFIRKVGKESIDDMLAIRTGDRIGSGARITSWRTELFKKRIIEAQKVPFQIKDLKISGHDVMKTLGIKPGPKVGEILQTIFDEVDEGRLKNTRKVLLKRLKEI